MSKPAFSPKGLELIRLYEVMARDGFMRGDDVHVTDAFSDFQLRAYRQQLLPVLQHFNVRSLLDYGCGGSDWQAAGFDKESGKSAAEYFALERALRYEPARGIDERAPVDCVVSFDVLEHIFVSDVPAVLRDMFSYAGRLLLLNIACYPAAARLPNGENAHITVREPAWWKGMVDSIAVEFPATSVCLITSTAWRQSSAFPVWSAAGWQASPTFVTNN